MIEHGDPKISAKRTASVSEAVLQLSLIGFMRLTRDLLGVNAYALAAAMLRFETKNAVDLCKQGIVLADADIVAGVEMGTTLTNEDIACKNELTVRTLGSETFGFAVAAVAGTTNALFVCKKLQIDPEHSSNLLLLNFEIIIVLGFDGAKTRKHHSEYQLGLFPLFGRSRRIENKLKLSVRNIGLARTIDILRYADKRRLRDRGNRGADYILAILCQPVEK